MKKIMGAVLAAAMLAGTVTAADIGFSYKGSNYFQNSGLQNLGYQTDKRKDCLSVKLVTEAAGVVVDFDNYKDKNDKDDKGGIKKDEYYGWLNFGLPLGSLQVTAGAWNGRFVNRVIADKGDLDPEEFELYKPGVIDGLWGEDSDNLTLGNLGMVAAWTLADMLPGTLMVKLGLAHYAGVDKDDKEGKKIGNWNPDYNSVAVHAGLTGEVAYRADTFSVNLAVRSLTKKAYSFGAWVSPVVGDGLQMTLGGTFATGKIYTGGEWSDRKTEWGVDFRLRFQVNDDLSITTMNNISSAYEKDTGNGENNPRLWNMVNATYRFADNLKASFTLQSVADVLCPHYDERDWNVIVSPSLIIQASEQARVTTSLRAKMADIRNYALKNIVLTVPVIFSFNY